MKLKVTNRGTRLVKVEADKHEDKIVVPDGIAVVSQCAFWGSDDVKEVVFPQSLISIGDGAFSACKSLEKVGLPKSLERIGARAFDWCENLKNIELPDMIQSIREGTFLHCKNLRKIRFPAGLERIESQAFYMCDNLERLDFPAGLEVIGEDCFYKCKNLKYIKIPSSLIEIGDSAFEGCENVEELVLGDFPLLYEDGLWKFIDNGKSFHLNEQTGEILIFSKNIEHVEGHKRLEYEKIIEKIHNVMYWKLDCIVLSTMFTAEDLKKLKSIQYLLPQIVLHINKDNYKIVAKKLKNNSKEFIGLNKRLEKNHFDSFLYLDLDVFKLACCLGALSDDKIDRQKACEFVSNIFEKGVFDHRNFHGSFESLKLDFTYNKDCAEFLMDKNNFAELIELEKEECGYIARIIDCFDEIKEFGRSNRGSQRYRKVTVDMCKQYMSIVNFKGVDESNEDIVEAIKKYTRKQESFDEATAIRKKYLELKRKGKIKEHLLDEELFSVIDDERESIISDACETLEDMNVVSNRCFSYEFLSKYDPRNFVLGKYCSCCAHLEGAGHGIMKASILHPDCQNLVIKDEEGNIISKSTLYINREQGYGLFNNVEVNNNLIYKDDVRKKIYEKYIEAVEAFVRRYNELNPSNPIKQINVGMNLNDLFDELSSNKKISRNILKGVDFQSFGGYSGDWQETQCILWKSVDNKSKKR